MWVECPKCRSLKLMIYREKIRTDAFVCIECGFEWGGLIGYVLSPAEA